MTTDNFIRLVLRDIPNVLQSDYSMVSDCMFRAIRQIQENTFCSKIRVNQVMESVTMTSVVTVGASDPKTVTINKTAHGLNGVVRLYVSGNARIPDGWYNFTAATANTLTATIYTGIAAGTTTGGTYSLYLSDDPYQIVLYPEFRGTDYAPARTTNRFNIIPLRVDGIWVVNSDDTLDTVYLDGTREVQDYKDAAGDETDTGYSGVVETEGEYVKLRTHFDLTGYTLQFWISYQIPYIADAFISTVTIGADTVDIKNSLLETIPLRYQDRLISGVKYHLYKALEEKTNAGEYVSLMQYYENEWKKIDLPRVMQECNRPMTKETVSKMTTKTVFTMV